MKTETVKLSQLKLNAANPRQIKDEKLEKLVDSLLVFPKMLKIRPIVVDSALTSLGGNMRHRALSLIAEMPVAEVKERLEGIRDYGKKAAAEQAALLEYWEKWLANPTAIVIKASELSEQEKREFIIKDNASFGEWDYGMLDSDWEDEDLDDWGVDEPWEDDDEMDEDDGEMDAEPTTGLPPELLGVDLAPGELKKIQGDDKTLTERIIIVYPPEKKSNLEKLLGIQINKVVFSINELTAGFGTIRRPDKARTRFLRG
jgi:hypothetical protein